MGFLTDVVGDVRRRLERSPLDDSRLLARAMSLPPPRPFERSLSEALPPALIAEIKRASPSSGSISDLDVAGQASAYEEAGAVAISVLTETAHFDGSLADLRAVRRAVGIPLLRKDFLVYPSQVIEARVAGADAVLLIAAVLSESELKAMLATAADLGLGSVVEVHGQEDLDRALASEAPVIGVNARDLETLEVKPDEALALLSCVPADRIAVFESGVRGQEDVRRAVAAGAAAVLVGEALMRAADPGAAIRSLRGQA